MAQGLLCHFFNKMQGEILYGPLTQAAQILLIFGYLLFASMGITYTVTRKGV
jgi:hypothetical protein